MLKDPASSLSKIRVGAIKIAPTLHPDGLDRSGKLALVGVKNVIKIERIANWLNCWN